MQASVFLFRSEAEYSAVYAELCSFVGDSVVTQQMCCDEELPYCFGTFYCSENSVF